MPPLFRTAIVSLSLFSLSAAGALEETVKAFERRPDYVRPFATIAGTMTNSGWYQSAAIGKEFSFGIALPLTLIYLSRADRQYSGEYVDTNCTKCRIQEAGGASVNCRECVEHQSFTAPTIFGSIDAPEVQRSIIDLRYNVISTLPVDALFSDGVPELSRLSALPFITLQASFSAYYTALTLRYIGIPEIEGTGFQFPGFGIQHDFQHLLSRVPLSLSLAANFTFLNVGWTPGGDVEGKLTLGGLSHFVGVLAGYRPAGFFEIFLETGWEGSFLQPSGTLIVDNDIVSPSERLVGRNAFRAALNIVFPLQYTPVLGGGAGAQFANLINIVSYKSKKNE
jgi:hypothetical protein